MSRSGSMNGPSTAPVSLPWTPTATPTTNPPRRSRTFSTRSLTCSRPYPATSGSAMPALRPAPPPPTHPARSKTPCPSSTADKSTSVARVVPSMRSGTSTTCRARCRPAPSIPRTWSAAPAPAQARASSTFPRPQAAQAQPARRHRRPAARAPPRPHRLVPRSAARAP